MAPEGRASAATQGFPLRAAAVRRLRETALPIRGTAVAGRLWWPEEGATALTERAAAPIGERGSARPGREPENRAAAGSVGAVAGTAAPTQRRGYLPRNAAMESAASMPEVRQ